MLRISHANPMTQSIGHLQVKAAAQWFPLTSARQISPKIPVLRGLYGHWYYEGNPPISYHKPRKILLFMYALITAPFSFPPHNAPFSILRAQSDDCFQSRRPSTQRRIELT